MMKYTLTAGRRVALDGKIVEDGEVVAIIETDHPIDRILSALRQGHVVMSSEPITPQVGHPAAQQTAKAEKKADEAAKAPHAKPAKGGGK